MKHLVAKVGEELTGWQRVAEMLAGEDLDERTLLDTLEGQTELHEALLAVHEHMLDNEALADGISLQVEKMKARASRLKRTNETLRNVILMAMETAGIKTITGPLATLSVRDLPPAVTVTDEALIPSHFFVLQPPKLDKTALKTALGTEDVPGAVLGNGGVSPTIRRA